MSVRRWGTQEEVGNVPKWGHASANQGTPPEHTTIAITQRRTDSNRTHRQSAFAAPAFRTKPKEGSSATSHPSRADEEEMLRNVVNNSSEDYSDLPPEEERPSVLKTFMKRFVACILAVALLGATGYSAVRWLGNGETQKSEAESSQLYEECKKTSENLDKSVKESEEYLKKYGDKDKDTAGKLREAISKSNMLALGADFTGARLNGGAASVIKDKISTANGYIDEMAVYRATLAKANEVFASGQQGNNADEQLLLDARRDLQSKMDKLSTLASDKSKLALDDAGIREVGAARQELSNATALLQNQDASIDSISEEAVKLDSWLVRLGRLQGNKQPTQDTHSGQPQTPEGGEIQFNPDSLNGLSFEDKVGTLLKEQPGMSADKVCQVAGGTYNMTTGICTEN